LLRGYWSGPVPATAQQTITDPSVFTLCDLVCEAVHDRLDALQAVLPPARTSPAATRTGSTHGRSATGSLFPLPCVSG